MLPRCTLAVALVFLVAAGVGTQEPTPGWFPFVIPWDDASHGATDVSGLNKSPAGAGGFVTVKDGHFFEGNGQRIRFLGVNFCFNANFPHKADAPKVAGRLRKYGVNIVRLHLMDYYPAPKGIFDPRFKDMQHLDAEQLDRLDYFVAQLKKNGIYVNVNLHVARRFSEHDGFADAAKLPAFGAVVNYFEPRMIELQKKYARDLLTHHNPYTKTTYAQEPAVACIELTNENTLLAQAYSGGIDRLPPGYRGELARQWTSFLKARHGDLNIMKAAWNVSDLPLGGDLLRNGTFTDGVNDWRLEVQKGFVADAKTPADAAAPPKAGGKVLRLAVTQPGTQAWQAQIFQPGLDLKEGQKVTLAFWARADRKRSLNVNATLDQPDWHNVGLFQKVALDTEWRPFSFTFQPSKVVAGHNRIGFQFGSEAGVVELAGVSLQGAAPAGGIVRASFDNAIVPLGSMGDHPQGRDWAAFLMAVEGQYVATMREYLRKDLGVRCGITGSQASYGGIGGAYRERLSDFVDMHAYWQHPKFPRKNWDLGDWYVPNIAMTKDKEGGTLPGLSRYRLAGQPFTVSEYNHSAPNDYQAECVPMLTAMAAFQDWDAIYLFDYASDRDAFKSDKIRGFFSIDSNPAKMAFMPAAAMLFTRGDLPAAVEETQLRIPEASVADMMVARVNLGQVYDKAGAKTFDILTKRVSLAFVPGEKGPAKLVPGPTLKQGANASALNWTGRGTDQALFTVDVPRAKVIVGFLGARTATLAGLEVRMPKTPTNFVALTLNARDALPTDQSKSLLLTAVSRVENAGVQWNAERTSVVRNWGEGPVQAEGVPCTVSLTTKARSAVVYALDGSGRQRARVESRLANGQLTFAIGPTYRTLWYEIEMDGK